MTDATDTTSRYAASDRANLVHPLTDHSRFVNEATPLVIVRGEDCELMTSDLEFSVVATPYGLGVFMQYFAPFYQRRRQLDHPLLHRRLR